MLVIYNCVSKCFTLKITVVQCVLWKLINGKKFSWTFNMASNLPKPCTLKKWTAEFKWLESCNNYTYCQICMNWQKKLLVQTAAVHLLWKVATTGEEVHWMHEHDAFRCKWRWELRNLEINFENIWSMLYQMIILWSNVSRVRKRASNVCHTSRIDWTGENAWCEVCMIVWPEESMLAVYPFYKWNDLQWKCEKQTASCNVMGQQILVFWKRSSCHSCISRDICTCSFFALKEPISQDTSGIEHAIEECSKWCSSKNAISILGWCSHKLWAGQLINHPFKRDMPWVAFVWCFTHRFELVLRDALSFELNWLKNHWNTCFSCTGIAQKKPVNLKSCIEPYRMYMNLSTTSSDQPNQGGTRWIGHKFIHINWIGGNWVFIA